MKRIIPGVTLLLLILWSGFSVSAQENIRVYNQNREVTLAHELFCYNEQYYLHLDDLQQLGLTVVKENNKYTISSKDCLGVEKKIVMTVYTIASDDFIIISPIDFEDGSEMSPIIGLLSTDVEQTRCDASYMFRSTEKIGNPVGEDIFSYPEDFYFGTADVLIRVNRELYISADYVGQTMSHLYSFENNRMDFYIADEKSVITDVKVNLIYGTVAPKGGHNAKICTAYKIGDGEAVDDFELLSELDCTIPEGENGASFMLVTPAEKINDENMYFIMDCGDRYVLVCEQFDFSKVGRVRVYGQPKDITYTINVSLPEADEVDVPFTIYAKINYETYWKSGVVKSGEKMATLEMTGLPVATQYDISIEFGCHKYRNARLGGFNFYNMSYVKDFETDYSARYSRKAVCTVSLPENFIPEKDVELSVCLKKYNVSGGLAVVDNLLNWNDKQTIVLNNEKRSERICLYSQSAASMLVYQIDGDVQGLCKEGYLQADGKTLGNITDALKIEDDIVVDIRLLKEKNIPITISRPQLLSAENDIFAIVELKDVSSTTVSEKLIDFTETPLILAGERTAQLEIAVGEDKQYELKIWNISGDERLFDYCCYVNYPASVSEQGKKQCFGYDCEEINLTLLACNNISGRIECENDNLKFRTGVSCKLNNGETIRLMTTPQKGEFSFKIPEDTESYVLDVQTGLGKKSYYVAEGISTNDEEEASGIFFEYGDDKTVLLEYIPQNPLLPVKISYETKYNYFLCESNSDYSVENVCVYVVFYDVNGRMVYAKKNDIDELESGQYLQIPINAGGHEYENVRAFVWRLGDLTPLGNMIEVSE